LKRGREIQAIREINLNIRKGECFGVVGESGSGKSTLGKCIAGLIEPSEGTIDAGDIRVPFRDRAAARLFRRNVAMIFQDPLSSLNPKMRVFDIVADPLRVHGFGKSETCERVASALRGVGLPEDACGKHPHEFSGGQRQRIGIARALILNPGLLIADEPVSALDVSIQAQILNLLMEKKESEKLTLLFITHDLRLVEHICDRVCVMSRGRIVETGKGREVIRNPSHPYTRSLVDSIPGF